MGKFIIIQKKFGKYSFHKVQEVSLKKAKSIEKSGGKSYDSHEQAKEIAKELDK